jgi:uncharacterized membrane protein YdfJ with MMPL/SSD domain
MMAMLSSDLMAVGQLNSTIGIGLLLDTLIVRSFITQRFARLLGPPCDLGRRRAQAVRPKSLSYNII